MMGFERVKVQKVQLMGIDKMLLIFRIVFEIEKRGKEGSGR